MLKKTILSFALAIQNIRSNLFHTMLSVLGIVIGVAALVSILSFIDGLEKFAKDQITESTSLNTIMIRTVERRQVGAISLKKDSFALLDYATYSELTAGLPNMLKSALGTRMAGAVMVEGNTDTIGALLHAQTDNLSEKIELAAGQKWGAAEVTERKPVIVVNQDLAKQALKHERYGELIGKTLRFGNRSLVIAGVIKTTDERHTPQAFLPVTLLTPEELREEPPTCFIEAATVETLPGLKTLVQERLKSRFGPQYADFEIFTNDIQVEQAAKGFMLFRIVMGLIVGISILVGGIGVMNVLLISVNERTSEIGIRKAVGANRRDILRLFLAESITVSAFGSFLGLAIGVLATMAIIPIIKALTDLPFDAAYTWNTFFTISVIAILVGIIFGTYPAMKASKLDPVEAIRRE
jgi:putative ABC transport system permease protein